MSFQSLLCTVAVDTIYFHFLQHKQRNLVWTKGTDALEGELQSSSEVDFYIDQVKSDCICYLLKITV